jgi:micrococcal nuclease
MGMVAVSQFDYAYTRRTLELLHQSGAGPYEVTNLINCLLGLLLVPKDSVFAALPDVPVKGLSSWGITRKSIRKFSVARKSNGRKRRGTGNRSNGSNGHAAGPTLRQLVEQLRTAVAGGTLKPRIANNRFVGLELRDGQGFHMVLTTLELKRFVRKLAQYLGGYCDLDAAETRFVASWQRKPFHRPDCKWARRIRRKNLQGVRTRGAAVKAGHRPCRVCKP